MFVNVCYILLHTRRISHDSFINLDVIMVLIPEEKRRYPRIKLKRPLRYQIRGTPEFNNAIVDNISVGGLGFVDNKFIAPRTSLMLEINVLSRILRPVGKIAWSSPLPHSNRYYSGIEFLELDPVEKRFLADYINMQMGKLY